MEINRHSKGETAKFDQQWRAALRASPRQRRRFGFSDLSVWQERARLGLLFAHDQGTKSGTITFGQDEPVPHPSELCERLGLDSVWFFSDGYRWAVHAEHEDWELADIVEESGEAD